MKFRISVPSFVLGEHIRASPQEPIVRDFASDVDLDHVSATWEPLDKEASDALVRLSALSVKRQEEAGVSKPIPKPIRHKAVGPAPQLAPISGAQGDQIGDTMSELAAAEAKPHDRKHGK